MYGNEKHGIDLERAAKDGERIVEEWKRGAGRLRAYRIFLAAFLVLTLTGATGLFFYGMTKRIPSTLYFRARASQSVNFGIPATGQVRPAASEMRSNVPREGVTIDLSGPVKLQTAGKDRYDMQVRLFGWIPLKNVDIRVIEDQELIPMGIPIGIYLKSDGIMVIGTAQFQNAEGEMVSPAASVLQSGDVIHKINGRKIDDKEEMIKEIEGCGGRAVALTIKRGGTEENVTLWPARDQTGQYKIGIWVRDNAQGVGTLTFVDANGRFGALGHGIADVDTGVIVEASGGALYQTEIVNLRRGERGTPGEMTGRITYDDRFVLGEIEENSDRGVYGTCNAEGMNLAAGEPLPIALRQEIELGPATILCTLDHEVESFNVEVTRIRLEGGVINRGIELRVVDEELLQRAGGIIQGMSGSPILQKGKIIGAVTHVLVNSPEKGYGIFIENMLGEVPAVD